MPTSMRRTLLLAVTLLLAAPLAPAFAQQAPPPPVTKPAPAAPPAAPAKAPSPAAPVKPDEPPPTITAKELLAKHLAASGGEAALDAITSITTQGTFEMPMMAIKAPMVTKVASPNKLFVHIDLGAQGPIESGFDGTVGWSNERMSGPRLMEGRELEQLKRDADPKQGDLLKRFDKVEVVRVTVFAGTPAYEVRCTQGTDVESLFFDKDSGLLTGKKGLTAAPGGEIPVETTMKEYKEFPGPKGAVKLPTRNEITMMSQTLVMTITAVDFAPIDDKAFDLPPAIAALAKEKAEKEKAEKDAVKPAVKAPEPVPPSKPTAPTPPTPPTKPTDTPKNPSEPAKPATPPAKSL